MCESIPLGVQVLVERSNQIPSGKAFKFMTVCMCYMCHISNNIFCLYSCWPLAPWSFALERTFRLCSEA